MAVENEDGQLSLIIDDQSQSIQGVKIPDRAIYQNIKFVGQIARNNLNEFNDVN